MNTVPFGHTPASMKARCEEGLTKTLVKMGGASAEVVSASYVKPSARNQ